MPLFGSLMPFILDNGCPIVALRKTENHFKNIESNNLSSMVVFPLTPLNVIPSTVPLPKVNLKGTSEIIPVNKFISYVSGFASIGKFIYQQTPFFCKSLQKGRIQLL